jgi:hypothetical protein
MTDIKKNPKPKNREYIRVAVASKLLAGYFHANGKNLKGSSVVGCGRWKAYGENSNIAEIVVDESGARMHGHFRCGSVWTCDHCARARVAQTRSWIRGALIPAIEGGNMCASMMTFTMAHSYECNWSESIEKLHDAYKLFDKRMGREFKKINAIGKLKTLEAPIGKNGIHDVVMDISAFESVARFAWHRAVIAVGGHCNEHGFDIKLNAVADYLAKQEISHEMASHGTKGAMSKGFLIGQLLDKSALGDTKASAEWIRAIEALQGRARFHAGNIAEKLGIPNCTDWEVEEPNDTVSDEITQPKPQATEISYNIDKHLKATASDHPRPGLALILRVARSRRSERVLAVVNALCDEYDAYKLKTACTPLQRFAARMHIEVGRDLDFG